MSNWAEASLFHSRSSTARPAAAAATLKLDDKTIQDLDQVAKKPA